MVSEWQLSCLGSRIDSLAAEIQRVRAKDHPYAEPLVVYDALLSVLIRHSRMFKEQIRLFGKGNKRRFLDEYCGTLGVELSKVATVFSLVDRVDSSRIPFEILRALSWAAQELLGTRYTVVVRVDPVINYSILSAKRVFESHGWEADWLTATKKFDLRDDDILLLGIPSAYANSILLNALAAHEMGHLLFFAQHHALSLAIQQVYSEVQQKHQPRLQEYVMTDVMRTRQSGPVSDDYIKTADAVSRQAFQTAVKWCSEVYSDLVGARLLGPAFLAAFDRVLVGRHSPTLSHPPNQLRRDILKDYFEKNIPEIGKDPVWAVLSTEPEPSGWAKDAFWAFEDEVCRTAAIPFGEALKTISSPFDDEFTLFSSTVSEMQTHIENLSPPSVVLRERKMWTNTQGFWSMFYAAWHFRLDEPRFNRFAERYGWRGHPSDAEEALGNLILQGLKSLELMKHWDAWSQRRPKSSV